MKSMADPQCPLLSAVSAVTSAVKSGPKKRKIRRADGYSICQRKDGRWEARVTTGYSKNGNPVRKSFYCQTRAEAVRRAQEFKSKLDSGLNPEINKDVSLGAWLDTWLKTYIEPLKAPKTIKYYKTFVRLHIQPKLGRKALRKLTVHDVQSLLNEKLALGLSANFVIGLRATLRVALSHAWRQGLVEHNVCSKTSPPKPKPQTPVHLEASEVKILLEASKGTSFGNLIAVALGTGMRLGEITGLLWQDIDFVAGVIHVNKQLQRVNGKLTLRELKSATSRRKIPAVGIVLESLKSEFSRALFEDRQSGGEFVFLNPKKRPLDQKYVDKHLKRSMADANVTVMSFHKLRHTAATLMVAAGVDLHQVKQQLGHSQISLTANLYAHGVMEAQRIASEKLNNVLTSGDLQP